MRGGRSATSRRANCWIAGTSGCKAMAATPTRRPNPPDPGGNPAAAALAALELPLPLAVAYSGGADSTVLLLAAVARWPGQVQAIHVHHGLQEAADAFAAHCADVCAQLRVPLQVRRVA